MISVQFDQGQIDRWAEDAKDKIREFAVEFLQDVSLEIVYNTPVVTGFLRGSWYATIGEAAGGEPGQGDPAGSIGSVVAGLKIGDVYTFENGASYAVFVENGTKHMAPRAMVGRALDRVQAIGDAAAARVGSRN